MSREIENAVVLFKSIVTICACYSLYSALLRMSGLTQFELFYDTQAPLHGTYLTGPFVLHNSLATFAGLAALASAALLLTEGRRLVTALNIARRGTLEGVQSALGLGILYILAFLISISALVASASRAGALATLCGLAVMFALAVIVSRDNEKRRWLVGISAIFGVTILVLFVFGGDVLRSRMNDLVDTGTIDSTRLDLWGAAIRMIKDAPLLGLGLGTFADAYPLYASQVLPFVMDKAHNDYLELAAGLGIPAALAWWTAWLLLAIECLRGVFRRQRNRQFALTAVGATVLVAVHSIFDFSLQIPAISLLYATILGIGVARAKSVVEMGITRGIGRLSYFRTKRRVERSALFRIAKKRKFT